MRALKVLKPILTCLLANLTIFAWAKDTTQFVVGIGTIYDDNLLRVAEGRPPFDGSYDDIMVTSTAGLKYDRLIGRQRVIADLAVTKVAFKNFTHLNYYGRDLSAAWHWLLSPKVEGKLELRNELVLAPYTDFTSSERNIRRDQHMLFDATWHVIPQIDARVAVFRNTFDYEAPIQRLNNRRERTVEIEGVYLPKSGSRLGLMARRVTGRYPFVPESNDNSTVSRFTQDEFKLKLTWVPSGHTRVDADAGWARRNHRSLRPRDVSGLIGNVSVDYARSKTTLKLTAWRSFEPTEGTVPSFTTNKGLGANANWAVSSRIQTRAGVKIEHREYDPRLSFRSSEVPRDRLSEATVSVIYSLSRKIKVTSGFTRQRRTGAESVRTGRSKSNSFQVGVIATF